MYTNFLKRITEFKKHVFKTHNSYNIKTRVRCPTSCVCKDILNWVDSFVCEERHVCNTWISLVFLVFFFTECQGSHVFFFYKGRNTEYRNRRSAKLRMIKYERNFEKSEGWLNDPYLHKEKKNRVKTFRVM